MGRTITIELTETQEHAAEILLERSKEPGAHLNLGVALGRPTPLSWHEDEAAFWGDVISYGLDVINAYTEPRLPEPEEEKPKPDLDEPF